MSTTVPNPHAVGYDFAVGQTVFYVNAVSGVADSVVRSISIAIGQAGPTTSYDIAFKNPQLGSTVTPSTNLYADVDSALAAYRALVLLY